MSIFPQRNLIYSSYYKFKLILKRLGKIEAIFPAKQPKKMFEIKTFLGYLNYFGHFSPKLSLAQDYRTLTCFIAKICKICTECEKLFTKLKILFLQIKFWLIIILNFQLS